MTIGAVLWVTGLSGAGKTTIGRVVTQRLRDDGIGALHLDGDEIRTTMPATAVGYERSARLALARHYAGLARVVCEQGLVAVVSTVSLLSEIHAENRLNFTCYLEVLLEAPVDVLRLRGRAFDKATIGPVVGLDIEPDWPTGDDVLRISSFGETTAQDAASMIGEALVVRMRKAGKGFDGAAKGQL